MLKRKGENMILQSALKRRSRYQLTDKSPLSNAKIVALVQEAVKQAPSAFNSQSTRVLVLFGKKHTQFWKLVKEELKKIVPASSFAPTEAKINSFAAAYGTLLFFEDWQTVEALQHKFPAYQENFPLWAYQANAMAEYLIWTSLAEHGLGASLQHYNPLVDRAVAETFAVPSSWKLIAQMPFGVCVGDDGAKEFMPIEERVKVME
jgi:hypothetical protein